MSVEFSCCGKLLASGGQDATITVWNLATMKVIPKILKTDSPILCVNFSENSKMLASGDLLGKV